MKESEDGIIKDIDNIAQRLRRLELYGSIDALLDLSVWLLTEADDKLSCEQINYIHDHLMQMISKYKEWGLYQ
jgi:hypothetical protein